MPTQREERVESDADIVDKRRVLWYADVHIVVGLLTVTLG